MRQSYYDNLSEDLFHKAVALVHQRKQQFQKLNNSEALEIANHIIDEATAKVASESKCRRGCSFCCYLNVDISLPEAEALIPFVTDELLPRLEKQSTCKSFKEFSLLDYPDRQCVFLKNGECSVYQNRPIACRKYHVVNDPSQCNTEDGVKQTASIANGDMEITADAFHLAFEPDNLARQILKLKSKVTLQPSTT